MENISELLTLQRMFRVHK